MFVNNKQEKKDWINQGFKRYCRLSPIQIWCGKIAVSEHNKGLADKLPWKIFTPTLGEECPEGEWDEVKDLWDMLEIGKIPQKPKHLEELMNICEELRREGEILLDIPTLKIREIKNREEYVYVSRRLYDYAESHGL